MIANLKIFKNKSEKLVLILRFFFLYINYNDIIYKGV